MAAAAVRYSTVQSSLRKTPPTSGLLPGTGWGWGEGPVLTVVAWSSAASPVLACVRPAVPGPGGVLVPSLGKTPHLGAIVDPLGTESTKACHMGVAREEAAVWSGYRSAQDVCDPMGRPSGQLGAKSRRAELVEGVLHRVLAHGSLHFRELGQLCVVQEERPLQVGLHGLQVSE